MGVVAILSDAVIWAATGTFLTAKLAKIDFLTIVTFRSIFAVTFIIAATFALGAQTTFGTWTRISSGSWRWRAWPPTCWRSRLTPSRSRSWGLPAATPP